MAHDPVDLVDEQNELKAHEVTFALWPKAWETYKLRRKMTWTSRPLDSSEKKHVPGAAGIYTLIIQPGVAAHPACSYVMYVGQAVSLADRFYNYCTREKKIRPKIVRLLHMWKDYVHFCYCRVQPADLQRVEDALLESLIPPANSKFPGSIQAARKAF